MTPVDLKGKRFNRLMVLEYDKNSAKTGHAYWLCKCRCGKHKYIRATHLKTGSVRSCGCLAKEVSSRLLKKYANSKAHKGVGNPSWKGTRAKYQSFHQWLNRNYKKKRCQKCGVLKPLDWALKQGQKHGHDRKRYIVLCRSHHIRYDRSYA